MSKTLIVYFSRAGQNWGRDGLVDLRVGHTAVAASILEKLTEADVFKVVPAFPYPADYQDCCAVAKQQLETGARPALRAWPEQAVIDECRTLLLCSPNYCGTLPMPVWTFLEKYDWTGKTILPLVTHGGGGMANCEKDLAALCPGAILQPGIAIPGDKAAGAAFDLQLWLMSSGVPLAEAE